MFHGEDNDNPFGDDERLEESFKRLEINVKPEGLYFGDKLYIIPGFEKIKDIGITKDNEIFILFVIGNDELYYILEDYIFPEKLHQGVIDHLTKINCSADILNENGQNSRRVDDILVYNDIVVHKV